MGSKVFPCRHVLAAGLLHLLGTFHKGLDVEAGTGDGQQAHGREHGETAAHVVGDDVALVALLVSTCACGAALGIGDGHNDFFGHLLPALGLALLLQQTEGEGGLGGGAALRDVDDAELLILQVLGEFKEIVFANVVASKENGGLGVLQPAEAVAQGLDDGFGTQIAAADTGHHDGLAVLAKHLGRGHDVVDEGRGDAGGQVQPAQEIIAWAGAVLQGFLGGLHFWFKCFYCARLQEAGGFFDV